MELIDRDAVLKTIPSEEMVARMAVMSAPTVDAVPVRHARLINAHPYGECSCCGELIDSRDRFRYCPHCGARLVGEGEKDETNKCG